MKALVRKIQLGLSNRDGKIMVGQDTDGKCYLIAEADTFHNEETFFGLGSTEHIEISKAAFDALAPLALARQFHNIYERLAPSFGYETCPETRDFNPDSPNGRLMVAICTEIIGVRP
jgi:hypothetical protein